MKSLVGAQRFYFQFFHLQGCLTKSLHSLKRAYKFRKVYPKPLSAILLKTKYLKYLTVKIQLQIMNSMICKICNKFSITESSKEVQSIGSLSNSSSIRGLPKKEEKTGRCRCKESIKLGNELSFNKRRTLSTTLVKSKNSTFLAESTCTLRESNKISIHDRITDSRTNFVQSNCTQTLVKKLPKSTISLPCNNSVSGSLLNSQIRRHVHRSNSAEYSNSTKAAYLDRQRAWSLRRWQRTPLGKLSAKRSENPQSCTFKIMTYNILAQELLEEHTYLYTNHNPNAITWDQRWHTLLTEIKYHNADILCLQEVQVSHLNYFAELHKLGYKSIYKQRTGMRTDGCAIYYKHSLFNLVEYTSVEFNQADISVLNRDNVAIIAKFAPKNNTENEFVVSTTHLLYNPRREDVRLAQTQVLFTEIDRIAYKYNALTDTDHIPVIVTGDFNLTPDSAVYRLITDGFLKYEHLSNRSLSKNTTYANVTGKVLIPTLLRITDSCQHADLVEQRNKYGTIDRNEELKLIQLQHSERDNVNKTGKKAHKSSFSSGTLSHHLNLKSAYIHNHGNDTEATTFQNKWVTVDYIFYSGEVSEETQKRKDDRLKLLSRFTLPTSEQIQGLRIPNFAFGSDHLSLVVTFRLDP